MYALYSPRTAGLVQGIGEDMNLHSENRTLLFRAIPSRDHRVSLKARLSRKETNARKPGFDVESFPDAVGLGRKVGTFRRKEIIFAQGDPAQNVMYIQEGSVKLTVVNGVGKEGIVAILGPGDFLGEGCLAGQSSCMTAAMALTHTTVLVIEREEMIRMLHGEHHEFSDRFIVYMLARNTRVEENLIDHLFNSAEKRLARTLLQLASYEEQSQTPKVISNVSQEMLAEMIGSSRSRVNLFMNKFRKRGFIRYNGTIHVNESLLNVVQHD
jgi:CRP/FNR family cyclic AMP-dependent transcriptional regulator